MRGTNDGCPQLVVGGVEGDEMLGRVDGLMGLRMDLAGDGEGEHGVVDFGRGGFGREGPNRGRVGRRGRGRRRIVEFYAIFHVGISVGFQEIHN